MNNISKESKTNNTENSMAEVKKKQQRNMVIVITAIVSIVSFLGFVLKGGDSKTVGIGQDKTEFASAIKHVDAGSVLIERTEKRLARAEKSNQELQNNIEILNKERLRQEEIIPQEQEKILFLMKRVEDLENKIKQGEGGIDGSFAGREGQQSQLMQNIRDDSLDLISSEERVVDENSKTADRYVPSGTFVKAVALGGADASAAVNSQSNPQPMLFRIIENGTLPNNQKSRLKGCLVTAAAVGDISSERGFIRLETMSCVKPKTKEVLDINVEGTVFGPEGKSGIRGTPMWREGALLQRAFAAGALSGLAGGVSQKYTQTSISPLGAIQSTSGDVKDILAQGAATSLGNAMEKLADYNIKRAEQYHPVLQLSAGTVVDIVFLKGFHLEDPNKAKAKHNSYTSNIRAMQSETISGNSNYPGVNQQNNLSSLPFTSDQISQLKGQR